MKSTKISEIENLVETYKDRIKLIKSRIRSNQWNADLENKEIDTLEEVIEDIENILES